MLSHEGGPADYLCRPENMSINSSLAPLTHTTPAKIPRSHPLLRFEIKQKRPSAAGRRGRAARVLCVAASKDRILPWHDTQVKLAIKLSYLLVCLSLSEYSHMNKHTTLHVSSNKTKYSNSFSKYVISRFLKVCKKKLNYF